MKRQGPEQEEPEPKKRKQSHFTNQPETAQKKECVLFIGNPGAGKSTLLNSLVGKSDDPFQSGVNYGPGLTTIFQYKERNGVVYGDTPGLADIKMREMAARELEKALKQNGNYRIIFVLLLDSGRIRPADLSTVKLVVDAVSVEFPYAVVINKLSARVLNDFKTKPDTKKAVLTGLNCTDFRPPCETFDYPADPELVDADNVFHEPKAGFAEWLKSLPSCEIVEDNISEIKANEFDRQLQVYEEKMEALRKQMLEHEEAHKQQITLLQESLDRERERVERAEKDARAAKKAAERAAEQAAAQAKAAKAATQSAPTTTTPVAKKKRKWVLATRTYNKNNWQVFNSREGANKAYEEASITSICILYMWDEGEGLEKLDSWRPGGLLSNSQLEGLRVETMGRYK